MNKYISQIRVSAEKIQNTVNKIKLLYSDKPLSTEVISVSDVVNSTVAEFIAEYTDIKYIVNISKDLK